MDIQENFREITHLLAKVSRLSEKISRFFEKVTRTFGKVMRLFAKNIICSRTKMSSMSFRNFIGTILL